MTAISAETGPSLYLQDNFLTRNRQATWRFIRLQPLGAFGILIIVLVVIAALFSPYLWTSDPEEFGRDFLQGPSADYWMGTNRKGQDLWSRVIYGTRPSLMIGIGAVGISMVVAVSLSLAAGFLKGFIDILISRLIEILIAVPGLLWLILFTTAVDRSITTLMFAITFSITPLTTRVLRGNVIQEAASTYSESARVVGASNMRIMFRHILPNLLPLAIVNASIIIPAAILLEAGLTFLGLGLEPGTPSWGVDLGPNARSHFASGWWLPVFPGLALSLTVLAFNFLGDSLRDVLDPRLRGSGLV